ncbi:MAG: ribosome assembly cofactor RimP [Chitinophagales bacterium]
MDNENLLQRIESMVSGILSSEPDYFLVEARIKPTNNIKIFLDGDQGITIEKCVQFNRALYKKIEEANFFPSGDFSLEVSSPGLDEPLKIYRQYRKNIGRPIEVMLTDGTRKEGKLLEVTEDGIIVEELPVKKNPHGKMVKNPVLMNHSYLFNNIKSTKIQVVF